MSFPTERSVNFPSRKGTLNYYDDPTHKGCPPKFDDVIDFLKKRNMKILFSARSYKPILSYVLVFFAERASKKEKILKRGTWAFWGFETIIWAKKIK